MSNIFDSIEIPIPPSTSEDVPSDEIKSNNLDNDIVSEKRDNSNYSKQFDFNSNWLNIYNQTVFNHTTSGYNQIEIKALQNIAYLFSYGGLRTEPFFILDLCNSGRGKTTNIKLQSELLLSPVYEMQEEKLKTDIERYEIETKEAKGKDKDLVQAPQLHKCIHSSDISKEALFESFEAVPSQLLEFGEFGQRLKNKNDGVIDYIIDGHGAKRINAPAYKNQRFNKTLKVEGISLFFIGDTTLTYLGKKNFYEHLQGGLINRCIIVYDDYLPKYEEIPKNYYISEDIKKYYNDISMKIIDFGSNNSDFKGIDYSYTDSKYLQAFEKELTEQKNDLLSVSNVFGNLYNRTIQNFRAIINILHFIKCFDNNRMEAIVSDDTIKEAVLFCKRYFSFDSLINHLNGINDEDIQDIQLQKIINKIEAVGVPCSFRKIYKPLKISRDNLVKNITGAYKIDTKQSIILEKLV